MEERYDWFEESRAEEMINVECSQCGGSLYRFPSQLKQKYGAFCDRHCLGKYRTEKLTGQYAANYKTGSRRNRNYIEVEANWHPNANARGYVFLHRLVAEVIIGRFLNEDEIVHHVDHNSRNNHWSNLKVMKQSEHALLHEHERNSLGQFISEKDKEE